MNTESYAQIKSNQVYSEIRQHKPAGLNQVTTVSLQLAYTDEVRTIASVDCDNQRRRGSKGGGGGSNVAIFRQTSANDCTMKSRVLKISFAPPPHLQKKNKSPKMEDF